MAGLVGVSVIGAVLREVLGLESLGFGRWSPAFRLGSGVVLLFERERSAAQEEPRAHGAPGSIHTAFLAAPGEYDAWKERLADRDVTLIDEIAWDSGVRSCYSTIPPAICSRSRSAISGPSRSRQTRSMRDPKPVTPRHLAYTAQCRLLLELRQRSPRAAPPASASENRPEHAAQSAFS
jgi:hypothetical protein